MKALVIILLVTCFGVLTAQESVNRDKHGSIVGYTKHEGKGVEIYYDEHHNKKGFSRANGKTITYYDKDGRKIDTFKK